MSGREPLSGVNVDRFVIHEGGFYQYVQSQSMLPTKAPEGLVFFKSGVWFTAERAAELLAIEADLDDPSGDYLGEEAP